MTLAALHVTKCRLCGQPSAGTGGLCSDCSRALARARQGPAALSKGPAAARKQRMVERIVLTSPIDPEPARSPKRAGAALWATIGVAVVVVLLAATANLSPQHPVEIRVSERPARVVPQLLEPVTESESAAVEPTAVPPQKTLEPPPLPNDSAKPTRSARSAPVRAVASSRPPIDGGRVNAAEDSLPPPETPVQQARAKMAPSPAVVDDSQALASALEQCNEEKFLAGVICEQKVRLRFCEGRWGQIPQCTNKPHAD